MLEYRRRDENSRRLFWLLIFKRACIAFNFIIMIESIISASFGVYFLIYRKFSGNMRRIEKFDESLTSEAIILTAWLLILNAIFLAFIGILGAISSIKENLYGLILYAGLLIVSFGILISCGIFSVVEIDYLKGTVSDAMRTLFNKAMIEGDQSAKYAIKKIQKSLKCCGYVGPSDYGGDIPSSCSFYLKGCNDNFFQYYRSHLLLFALSSFTSSAFHILGISLAIYFAKELRVAVRIVQIMEAKALRRETENRRLLQLIDH